MKAKEVIITARNRIFAPTTALPDVFALVTLVLGEFNDQDAILRGDCDKHNKTENKS
jgi:hypothetical protein